MAMKATMAAKAGKVNSSRKGAKVARAAPSSLLHIFHAVPHNLLDFCGAKLLHFRCTARRYRTIADDDAIWKCLVAERFAGTVAFWEDDGDARRAASRRAAALICEAQRSAPTWERRYALALTRKVFVYANMTKGFDDVFEAPASTTSDYLPGWYSRSQLNKLDEARFSLLAGNSQVAEAQSHVPCIGFGREGCNDDAFTITLQDGGVKDHGRGKRGGVDYANASREQPFGFSLQGGRVVAPALPIRARKFLERPVRVLCDCALVAVAGLPRAAWLLRQEQRRQRHGFSFLAAAAPAAAPAVAPAVESPESARLDRLAAMGSDLDCRMAIGLESLFAALVDAMHAPPQQHLVVAPDVDGEDAPLTKAAPAKAADEGPSEALLRGKLAFKEGRMVWSGLWSFGRKAWDRGERWTFRLTSKRAVASAADIPAGEWLEFSGHFLFAAGAKSLKEKEMGGLLWRASAKDGLFDVDGQGKNRFGKWTLAKGLYDPASTKMSARRVYDDAKPAASENAGRPSEGAPKRSRRANAGRRTFAYDAVLSTDARYNAGNDHSDVDDDYVPERQKRGKRAIDDDDDAAASKRAPSNEGAVSAAALHAAALVVLPALAGQPDDGAFCANVLRSAHAFARSFKTWAVVIDEARSIVAADPVLTKADQSWQNKLQAVDAVVNAMASVGDHFSTRDLVDQGVVRAMVVSALELRGEARFKLSAFVFALGLANAFVKRALRELAASALPAVEPKDRGARAVRRFAERAPAVAKLLRLAADVRLDAAVPAAEIFETLTCIGTKARAGLRAKSAPPTDFLEAGAQGAAPAQGATPARFLNVVVGARSGAFYRVRVGGSARPEDAHVVEPVVPGERTVHVAVQEGRLFALTESGKLFAVGDATDAPALVHFTAPVAAVCAPPLLWTSEEIVLGLHSGYGRTAPRRALFLDVLGDVYALGSNRGGELGAGEVDHVASPKLVLSGERISDVRLGGAHAVAWSRETGALFGTGERKALPPLTHQGTNRRGATKTFSRVAVGVRAPAWREAVSPRATVVDVEVTAEATVLTFDCLHRRGAAPATFEPAVAVCRGRFDADVWPLVFRAVPNAGPGVARFAAAADDHLRRLDDLVESFRGGADALVESLRAETAQIADLPAEQKAAALKQLDVAKASLRERIDRLLGLAAADGPAAGSP